MTTILCPVNSVSSQTIQKESVIFKVIINDKMEYSLIEFSSEIPYQWSATTFQADILSCLEYIQTKWFEAGNKDRCPICFPIADYQKLELHPLLNALRRLKKILWIRPPYGDDACLITHYQDVRTVLTDLRFSRATAARSDESRLTPHPLPTSIMGMDPPDHTRIRFELANVFTPKRVAALESKIRRTAQKLLNKMEMKNGSVDLVEDFTIPFSGLTICDLMGVPFEDRISFRLWLDSFASTTMLPEQEVLDNMDAMHTYIGKLINIRSRDSQDDLISGLIKARNKGMLSDKELIEFLTVFLIAGHDTVSAQLMCSLYLLLTSPKKREELQQQPEIQRSAVKELLRYVAIDAYVTFARYTTDDINMGETTIKKGEAVLISIISANRDSGIFVNPNELDLGRKKNPHLMFGAGIHVCPGANLALLEIEIAIDMLFKRFAHLELAVPQKELKFRKGLQVRSIESLPVVW